MHSCIFAARLSTRHGHRRRRTGWEPDCAAWVYAKSVDLVSGTHTNYDPIQTMMTDCQITRTSDPVALTVTWTRCLFVGMIKLGYMDLPFRQDGQDGPDIIPQELRLPRPHCL